MQLLQLRYNIAIIGNSIFVVHVKCIFLNTEININKMHLCGIARFLCFVTFFPLHFLLISILHLAEGLLIYFTETIK